MKLKEGDKAPDFTAVSQDGSMINLSQFKGRKVVLYFYPKDDTPGCTAQACNIRDNFSVLQSKGIVVLGVSADEVKKHLKFSDKYKLPFPLLADPERHILEAYGVWGEKKFMGRTFDGIHRTTFLINEKQQIEHIIEKVVTKDHTAQILALWALV